MDITYLGTKVLVGAILKSFLVSHILKSLNSIHAQADVREIHLYYLCFGRFQAKSRIKYVILPT
jgi:hypothetical protein